MIDAASLFDLTGRTALVTGASRGLGRQMAGALARAGADLVVTARAIPSLAETVREIEALGRRAVPVPLDLRDGASIRAAAAASRESGKDGADAAFGESAYSVGEDHTTPNSHSHQSEGARTSGGD